MVKTYDVKSFELAEHFLRDDKALQANPDLYNRCCRDLARTIQLAIEDWFGSDNG